MIFGDGAISLDQVADWCGTIGYEVLCLLSTRIPRKYTYHYTIRHYVNNHF